MTDSLKELAEAGEAVLGDSEWALQPAGRPGNWLFLGSIVAVILIVLLHVAWWAALLVTFGLGIALNEYERRQIMQRVAERKSRAGQ